MVNFVRYPNFLIVFSVVKHCLVNMPLIKTIDDLNLLKKHQQTIRSPAWNLHNCIRLNHKIDSQCLLIQRYAEVYARLDDVLLQDSKLLH